MFCKHKIGSSILSASQKGKKYENINRKFSVYSGWFLNTSLFSWSSCRIYFNSYKYIYYNYNNSGCNILILANRYCCVIMNYLIRILNFIAGMILLFLLLIIILPLLFLDWLFGRYK